MGESWVFLIIYLFAIYGLLNLVFILKELITNISPKNKNSPSISIILIVKDLENKVEGVVRSLLKTNINDLVVIDLGSKDQTPKILNLLAKKFKILKVINGGLDKKNQYLTGASFCEGEAVIILDVNERIHPEKLIKSNLEKEIGLNTYKNRTIV